MSDNKNRNTETSRYLDTLRLRLTKLY